jgi:hypothetical protein
VLSIVYIGAFEASRSWGDLFALLLFGVLGWVMKQFKWPRPPLVLGLVLGDSIERYMFISIERYGFTWLCGRWSRPADHGHRRPGAAADCRVSAARADWSTCCAAFQAPTFHPSQLFTLFYMAVNRDHGGRGAALALQRQARAAESWAPSR